MDTWGQTQPPDTSTYLDIEAVQQVQCPGMTGLGQTQMAHLVCTCEEALALPVWLQYLVTSLQP